MPVYIALLLGNVTGRMTIGKLALVSFAVGLPALDLSAGLANRTLAPTVTVMPNGVTKGCTVSIPATGHTRTFQTRAK